MADGAEDGIGDHVVRFLQHDLQQIVQRRRLGLRDHRAGDAVASLAFQMPVDLDAGLRQLIFQDGARVAGTVPMAKANGSGSLRCVRQPVRVKRFSSPGTTSSSQYCASAEPRAVVRTAKHIDRIIGGDADKRHVARVRRAVERDRETVAIDDGGGRRRAEALRQIVPRPAGRLVMAGEDRGVDQHVAADLAHALFLQDGHHIAQALALEGRIAAEAGNQVAAQHAVADIAPLSSVVVKR